MSTSPQISRQALVILVTTQTPIIPSSPAASDSSEDMDEQGGVSLEEIMGFSNFNGTKREPKHDAKSTGEKIAAPIGTGANSQPVVARQLPSMIGSATSHEIKPSPKLSAAVNPFIPASVTPTSLPPRPPQPNDDFMSQAQLEPRRAETLTREQASPADVVTASDTTVSDMRLKSALSTLPLNNESIVRGDTSAQAAPFHSTRYRDPNAVAYTNPTSGIAMTHAELNEYSRGKVQKMLDVNGQEYETKVHFQPSFLEDPWAGLR